jgi:pilus assembly protein Flp/PilA
LQTCEIRSIRETPHKDFPAILHSRNGAVAVKRKAGSPPMKSITRFLRDESGATAIEYGLIAALIAVAIIAAVELVGTNLTTTFNTVAAKI